mmetsp:Transcript_21953/g.62318  ORF Transcript_21953/g.62318 Transcript_21953/m.62318 type:complete len:217 (+) Transcript_21953:774-1424(+)
MKYPDLKCLASTSMWWTVNQLPYLAPETECIFGCMCTGAHSSEPELTFCSSLSHRVEPSERVSKKRKTRISTGVSSGKSATLMGVSPNSAETGNSSGSPVGDATTSWGTRDGAQLGVAGTEPQPEGEARSTTSKSEVAVEQVMLRHIVSSWTLTPRTTVSLFSAMGGVPAGAAPSAASWGATCVAAMVCAVGVAAGSPPEVATRGAARPRSVTPKR